MISADQLRRFLRYPADQPIDADDAKLAEEVAIGWLSDPTGVEEWAYPAPPAIRAWVLELAGIAYENPTSMENDASLDNSSSWRDRRHQILKAAGDWAARNGHTTPASSGVSRASFPPAQPLGRW